MQSLRSWLAVAALGTAGLAAAQSTGSMTSPQSGAASAGGGPVGSLLPSTVQSGSTAPTQPGHTITGDRDTMPRSAYRSSREGERSTAVARRDESVPVTGTPAPR
jgi:hypothetical protein